MQKKYHIALESLLIMMTLSILFALFSDYVMNFESYLSAALICIEVTAFYYGARMIFSGMLERREASYKSLMRLLLICGVLETILLIYTIMKDGFRIIHQGMVTNQLSMWTTLILCFGIWIMNKVKKG